MINWKEVLLKDFIILKRGYDLPKDQRQEGQYPVIASTEINDYHNEYKVLPPCVVTGRSGTLGKVQYVDKPSWPLNTTLYVKEFNGNNQRFVFYFLKTMKLEQYNSGAGVPTLNRNHINRVKIKIPALLTQEKIASILSAYDKLIENNNHRIHLLEKAAEELYKEWFVRMRFPGHENTNFVNGIPEGWSKIRISELIDFSIGGGWGMDKCDETFSEPVYVIRGTDFKTLKESNFDGVPLRYEKISKVKQRKLKDNDLILENSVNAQTRTSGSSFLVTERILNQFEQKVIPASFCRLIRLKDPRYAFYCLKTLEFIYSQDQMRIFQNIATNGIANFQFKYFSNKFFILLPPIELIKDLEKLDATIYRIKNQNLIKQRDLLLPRLMSGKLEV